MGMIKKNCRVLLKDLAQEGNIITIQVVAIWKLIMIPLNKKKEWLQKLLGKKTQNSKDLQKLKRERKED